MHAITSTANTTRINRSLSSDSVIPAIVPRHYSPALGTPIRGSPQVVTAALAAPRPEPPAPIVAGLSDGRAGEIEDDQAEPTSREDKGDDGLGGAGGHGGG